MASDLFTLIISRQAENMRRYFLKVHKRSARDFKTSSPTGMNFSSAEKESWWLWWLHKVFHLCTIIIKSKPPSFLSWFASLSSHVQSVCTVSLYSCCFFVVMSRLCVVSFSVFVVVLHHFMISLHLVPVMMPMLVVILCLCVRFTSLVDIFCVFVVILHVFLVTLLFFWSFSVFLWSFCVVLSSFYVFVRLAWSCSHIWLLRGDLWLFYISLR